MRRCTFLNDPAAPRKAGTSRVVKPNGTDRPARGALSVFVTDDEIGLTAALLVTLDPRFLLFDVRLDRTQIRAFCGVEPERQDVAASDGWTLRSTSLLPVKLAAGVIIACSFIIFLDDFYARCAFACHVVTGSWNNGNVESSGIVLTGDDAALLKGVRSWANACRSVEQIRIRQQFRHVVIVGQSFRWND